MRLVLSNDDGVDSPGILKLAERLKKDGHDVTVVAPSRERSTVGHSLTLHKPLRIHELGEKIYSVSGSPADCMHLALNHIVTSKPDLVISGINRGANLGADIFYSGTVAAAREAYLAGHRVLATSLCIGFPEKQTGIHWDTAIDLVSKLVNSELVENKKHWFLNMNMPNIETVKGIRWSRQGRRHYTTEVMKNVDPRGKPYFWVGGGPNGFDNTPGTDCVDVAEGYAAITPLKVDTTDDALMTEFKNLTF